MTLTEDRMRGLKEDRSSPANFAFAITPSDSLDVETITKSLLVDAAGTLRVTMANMSDGTSIDLPVIAGYNPLRVRRVWLTAKTAGNVFGLV